MFIDYQITGMQQKKQKKHKQWEKSGNYQYLIKMDILDNGNNKVMIWNVTIWITDSGRETVDVFATE